MRKLLLWLLAALLAFGVLTPTAAADHDGNPDAFAMSKLFFSPNATGAINSDLAFWGDRVYAGNYDGFRIFDISNPAAPLLLEDFRCHGPQNDLVVWENRIVFTAVDRTQSKPQCGSVDVAHDDPQGWEGVRIFDVSDPTHPTFIKGVYTDCGAHTITLWPKSSKQILLYVSSYPLRPGPTCGSVRGPEAGRDPLHGVIQVIQVPVSNPAAAKEIAELPITYPGDPDNAFVPAEHGLPGPPVLERAMRACHDIGVFVELRLAAAACAEQGQLWRVRPNGLPDTAHPIWVYDDNVDETGATSNPADPGVAVDFWHSATFSWDGKVVNFIDESFGSGCPTVTEWSDGSRNDTGRMFFIDTATGAKLSHFQIPRVEPGVYCSAHLGNVVRTADADLLVNAWYEGGIDVVDFSNPANPFETAWWDETSDNWSAYWYEGPSFLAGGGFPVYGTDGVENPPAGEGFQVFRVLSDVVTDPLPYLNPQTQERLLAD